MEASAGEHCRIKVAHATGLGSTSRRKECESATTEATCTALTTGWLFLGSQQCDWLVPSEATSEPEEDQVQSTGDVGLRTLARPFIEELIHVNYSTRLHWMRAVQEDDAEIKHVPAFFFAMKPRNLGSVRLWDIVELLRHPGNAALFRESTSLCFVFKGVYDTFMEEEARKASPASSNSWVLWKLVIFEPWLFDGQCGVLRTLLNLNRAAKEREPMEVPVHLWDNRDHELAEEINAANNPLSGLSLARLRNNPGFLQKALAFKRALRSALGSLSASISFQLGAGTGFPLVAFASILLTLSVEADLTSLLAQLAATMRTSGDDDVKNMVDKLDAAIPALNTSSVLTAADSTFAHKASASVSVALHLGYHVVAQFGVEVDVTVGGHVKMLTGGERIEDQLLGNSAAQSEFQASCLSPDYGLIHSWNVFPLPSKAWSYSGGLSLGCLRAVWHLVKVEVKKTWQATTSRIQGWFEGAENITSPGIDADEENNAAVSLGADEDSVEACEADSNCDHSIVETLQDNSDSKPSRWQSFKDWLASGWTMHVSGSLASIKVYVTRGAFSKTTELTSRSFAQIRDDDDLEIVANEHLQTLFGELSALDELKSNHRLNEDEYQARAQEQMTHFASRMDQLGATDLY